MSVRTDNRQGSYRLLRRLLFLVPPESIHRVVFAVLRGLTAVAPLRRLLRRRLSPSDPIAGLQRVRRAFPGPAGAGCRL